MLSQSTQQSQNKQIKCKKCNTFVLTTQLFEHYQYCQKQYLNSQPNSNQIPQNDQSNMNDDQKKLFSTSSNIQAQQNNLDDNSIQPKYQQLIGCKILKLCDICQEYLKIDSYYNHLSECLKQKQQVQQQENQIGFSTLQFSISSEIFTKKQNTYQVQEEFVVEIVNINDTTYKRTVITKDQVTGFTIYKTTYHNKENPVIDDKYQAKLNEEITTNDETTNQSISQEESSFSTPQPECTVKCTICNQEYKQLDEIQVFNSCKHQFHFSCIQNQPCIICTAETLQQC